MKKILNVIIVTLAVNFLAVAGGIGWLYKQGSIDRARITAIKEILFPKPVETPAASQPSDDPTTQPMLQLDVLLAKAAGRSASEQVEFIQRAFDAQMAQLDRRQRELTDLQRQVDLSKQQMAKDRQSLDAQQKALDSRETQAAQLASDKGFQDSLNLYTSLPAKQVKTIFMGLDEKTATSYLQAMEPRAAAKIMKEFKAPEETERVQRILERMRQAQASAKE